MPSRLTLLVSILSSACLPAFGQLVVSTRSGVIDSVDGSVFVDNRSVGAVTARFPEIDDGSTLRTGAGKAEVLLTPGVFLRIGDHSAVRMLSSKLTDTRVEMIRGSVILRAPNLAADDSVVVVFQQRQIQLTQPAAYRLDSNPPRLSVISGAAQLTFADATTTVTSSHTFWFSSSLVATKPSGPADALDRWSGRRDKLTARYVAEARRGSRRLAHARAYPSAPFELPQRTW